MIFYQKSFAQGLSIFIGNSSARFNDIYNLEKSTNIQLIKG